MLLDAHEVGEGASGRNSGFAIDLPHNVGGEFEELEGAHGYIRLSRAAIDYLDDCVTENGIACAYTHRGKYHAARTDLGREKILEPFARTLDSLGEPYRWSRPRSSSGNWAPPITPQRSTRRAGG